MQIDVFLRQNKYSFVCAHSELQNGPTTRLGLAPTLELRSIEDE